jgi:hypothetical protein
MAEKKNEIVSPINFAKELNVAPQYVYGLIREGKLESHECVCGHKYLVRTDATVTALVAKRAEKTAA